MKSWLRLFSLFVPPAYCTYQLDTDQSLGSLNRSAAKIRKQPGVGVFFFSMNTEEPLRRSGSDLGVQAGRHRGWFPPIRAADFVVLCHSAAGELTRRVEIPAMFAVSFLSGTGRQVGRRAVRFMRCFNVNDYSIIVRKLSSECVDVL